MKAPDKRTTRSRTSKVDFWHWTPEKSAEIGQWIVAQPGKRLEMRMEGVKVFFRMAGGVQTENHIPGHPPGDMNDSHACPPDCP